MLDFIFGMFSNFFRIIIFFVAHNAYYKSVKSQAALEFLVRLLADSTEKLAIFIGNFENFFIWYTKRNCKFNKKS